MIDPHCLKFKVGLGRGINIFSKLMALKLLLTLFVKKGITNIQIFGDSTMVVNWMRGIKSM
jgi:hypothetical protein